MSIRDRLQKAAEVQELGDPIYVRVTDATKEKLRIYQRQFKIKSLSEVVRLLVEDRLDELEKDSSDVGRGSGPGSGQTPASATG